jgi:hypothetical protein
MKWATAEAPPASPAVPSQAPPAGGVATPSQQVNQVPRQPATIAAPAPSPAPAAAPYLPPDISTFKPSWDLSPPDIHTAQKLQQEKAIKEAEGAEFYRAQTDETPAVYPYMKEAPKPSGPPITPEAYQAQKMGADRGLQGFAGDVEKAFTDHWTGLLVNALQGKSTFEAAGERIEATKVAIEHKQYIRSPEYKADLAAAQAKDPKDLTPKDEQVLKADPSFWQEVSDLGKAFAQHPTEMGAQFSLQMLKDLPTIVLTGEGIGALMDLKSAGMAAAEASKAAQTLKAVGQEAAQNIGGVAAVNYPQSQSVGEDYGLKEAGRDIVTGAFLGVGMHGVKSLAKLKGTPEKAPEATATPVQTPSEAKAKAEPSAEDIPAGGPVTVEKLRRQMQNTALIAQVRKAGAEAEIPPAHVDAFLRAHQYQLQRTDAPLDVLVEEAKKESPAWDPKTMRIKNKVPEPAVGTLARFQKAKDYLTKGAAEPSDMQVSKFLSDLGDGPVPVKDARYGTGTSMFNRMNRSHEFYYTEGLLRGRLEENQYTTPIEASKLPDQFDIFGTQLKRVKTKDPNLVRVKDEGGHTYDFKPDETVHTGGDLSKVGAGPEADRTNKSLDLKPDMQEEDLPLWQKGPNKPLMQMGEDKKEPPPTFYSQLKRVVDAKMPNAMGPESLKNMLKANAVKDEEIQWSGLDDFLKGKEKVTKKEIQDHLDQNQVEIKEITRKAQTREDRFGSDLPTKYDRYQQPGAENYRELLLTLPGKNHYQSGHWDEPNVLAHVRFNDRTTPEGKKVLHLEEVQSDWHQAGRKKGYELPKGKRPTQAQAKEYFGISDSDWAKMDHDFRESYVDEIAQGGRHLKNLGEVPDAPFKKTWHEMALRRMLRYAAEKGYDYLSWTDGEKQADRYDLSKHIQKIEYSKSHDISTQEMAPDGKYNIAARDMNGRMVVAEKMDEAKLEATFGKEITQKIVNGEGKKESLGTTLEGVDLKIGGKGIKGFYDKIIPDYLRKYGKKWGAGVEDLRAANVTSDRRVLWDEYKGIPITPEMKASVMEGQPLFQDTKQAPKGSYTFDDKLQKHVIKLYKGRADMSTLFHEYFHYMEQAKVIRPETRAALITALNGFGIKNPTEKDGKFTPEAAEKAARWYERWLRDGGAKSPELKAAFEDVKNAMRQIYETTRGTELQGAVPKEAAKAFEGLSKEMADTQPVEDSSRDPVQLQAMVVPGLKEFIEQDAGPATAEAKAAFKDLLSDLTKVLSPRVGVKMDALDLVYRMKGDREKAMFTMEQGMRHIKKMFVNMGDQRSIDFIDRIKRGQKQETQKLQDIADLYREIDNETFKEIIQHKPTLAYKEGHFRLFYSNSKILEANPKLKASLEGGRGFLKKMIFPDLTTAMEAGLKPISLNPQVLFEKGQADALRYISAQRMWQAMKDRNYAKFVKMGETPPDGYTRLDDKIGRVYFKTPLEMEKAGEYYLEPNMGRILNNYLSEDWIRSRAYGRSLLAIKNLTTGIELSLSPFHFIFESLDAMASKFGLGLTKIANEGRVAEGLKDIGSFPAAPFSFARAGGKALKYFSDKEAFLKTMGGQKFIKKFPEIDALMNDLFLGGGKLTMHEDYKINTLDTFKQNLNSHNYIGATLRAFPAFNEVLMKPLFEVYIPRLKIGLFLNEMGQQMRQNADELAKGQVSRAKLARDTWDRVENRFGEMNFDNLFWNRSLKSAMQLMFRSVTWKLGSIRGMGNAAWGQGKILAESLSLIKDAEGVRSFKKPKLDPSAAWMFGVLSTNAILSTIIQRSLTGQWPSQPIDFMFPKDGSKDKNGNDNRVSLPTYLRDAFSFKKSPVTYALHSMSGTASKLFDVLQNRDFYGDFVFDPEGPMLEKAMDIAKYMVPKPFSATQFSNVLEGQSTVPQKALSLLGVNKAPKEYIQTKFQEELARAFERQVGLKPKTPEQKELKQEKKAFLKDLASGKASGSEIMGAMESGMVKGKSLKRDFKMSGLSPMQYMWKMLNKDDKSLLEPLMSDKEHQILMWPHMPKMPKMGGKPKPVSA